MISVKNKLNRWKSHRTATLRITVPLILFNLIIFGCVFIVDCKESNRAIENHDPSNHGNDDPTQTTVEDIESDREESIDDASKDTIETSDPAIDSENDNDSEGPSNPISASISIESNDQPDDDIHEDSGLNDRDFSLDEEDSKLTGSITSDGEKEIDSTDDDLGESRAEPLTGLDPPSTTKEPKITHDNDTTRKPTISPTNISTLRSVRPLPAKDISSKNSNSTSEKLKSSQKPKLTSHAKPKSETSSVKHDTTTTMIPKISSNPDNSVTDPLSSSTKSPDYRSTNNPLPASSVGPQIAKTSLKPTVSGVPPSSDKPKSPAPNINTNLTSMKPASTATTSLPTKATMQPNSQTSVNPKSSSMSTNPKTTTPINPGSDNSTSLEPNLKGKTENRTPPTTSTTNITDKNIVLEQRDISYFLESHPAVNIDDVRSYFTDEKTSSSLFVSTNELCNAPKQLRFAYLIRIFIEMGRKVTSKINLIASEIVGLLKRTPDGFGNKPDTGMMMDLIDTTFETKYERPIPDTNETIALLIAKDEDKKRVFKSSVDQSGENLANVLFYLAFNSTKTCIKNIDLDNEHDLTSMVRLLSLAFRVGSKEMADEMGSMDKFALGEDGILLFDQITDKITEVIESNVRSSKRSLLKDSMNSFDGLNTITVNDLSHITDTDGLNGAWHNFMFKNLGSAERVIKLFASLLQRVPNDMKSKWINMYSQSALNEMRRTLPGFVSMQTYPYKHNDSESILLAYSKEAGPVQSKIDKMRRDYSLDKERLAARCYLTGRRWRLFLARSMRDYPQLNDVIKKFANSVSKWRQESLSVNGNDINSILCLPRLEVGLLGWGINGDPQGPEQAKSQFPLKNPLPRLRTIKDPFLNGYKFGYKIGFKIGYNEERNATLELEQSTNDQKQSSSSSQEPTHQSNNNIQLRANNLDSGVSNSNSLPKIDYVGRVSHRKASTASAARVFSIALEEGYLSSLRISLKAGLKIAAEAGAIVGEIRGKTFGSQEGREIGRVTADDIISSAMSVPEKLQKKLTIEGENRGLEAGIEVGALIGSLAGQEAAVEAYLQTVLGGGKLRFARFHMQEYVKGGNVGFDHGLNEGKRVASSSKLDPSAPRHLKLTKPEPGRYDVDSSDSWQDLIPSLNRTAIDQARFDGNQVLIEGQLSGTHHYTKELKQGLTRVELTNQTQQIQVSIEGFMFNDIAYLNINGTVDNQGQLQGTLAVSRFLDLKDWT